ncbi:MAG: RnfH family protein [Burkholderiales bacterium]
MTAPLAIVVAYAAPGVEAIVPLALPAGATVAQAVAASRLCERYGLAAGVVAYAIHGRRADGDAPLSDGDRVEITRPLAADAKEVRRLRAGRTGK